MTANTSGDGIALPDHPLFILTLEELNWLRNFILKIYGKSVWPWHSSWPEGDTVKNFNSLELDFIQHVITHKVIQEKRLDKMPRNIRNKIAMWCL